MKKYLSCIMTLENGLEQSNPLMLSEARLISTMAQNVKSIKVTCVECSKEEYKRLFGK